MAEIVKTVRIETGNGERSVKSLKKEISDLRDALLNVENGSEEWINISKELTKAQEDLNNVLKAGKQAVDADATSIAGMEARYKSLYQTYRLLTAEQRKSAEGMSMQKELAELSANLNKTKKDAGNFKDNIGHYAEDMMSAFGQLGISVGALQGPFKLATLGANGFKGALNVLAKHPIMTAIVVLIGLFKKVADAIKGNEELQMRWNKVVAAFKPIGDAVAIVLDKIAGVAVRVAEGVAKAVTWFTNLIGVSKELTAAEAELADKENELIKNRREFETLNSEDEARVAELREQAMITEDIVEKENLLNQAKEIQEQINKRNLKLAEDELDIIKQKNSLTPSSTEDLNKEAAAQQKVNQARAQGANALRTLEKGIKSAHDSANKAGDETKKKLDEILKRLDENTKSEKEKIKKKYEEELALLRKYHKDTTALEEEYQRAIYNIDTQYETARLNGYRSTGEAILSLLVQPSNAAFAQMEENAAREVMSYRQNVEEILGEKNWPIKALEKSQIFDENGALTKEMSRLNQMFNLGIEEGQDPSDVLKKLNLQLVAYQRNLAGVIKERLEWNKTTGETKEELELQKALYENNETMTYHFRGNLEQYAQAMGENNALEQKFYAERAEMARVAFENVKNLNEEQLNNLGLTLDDQLSIEKEYYDAREQLRQKDYELATADAERRKELNEELTDSIFELGTAHRQSIGSIVDTYKTLLDAYKKDGKISEQEAKKKAKTLQWLEGIEGAVAVAQIVADTASGWMSINKSLAAEYVLNAETAAATGPAAAATKAALDAKSLIAANIRKAALLVNGITAASAAVGKTIASIKGLQGDSDSAGGGASAAPMLIDSTPYSYTRELQTNVEREEQLNTPIYVRVTDIETAQARVRVTDKESTF